MITNTNLIADQIETISPVRPDKCAPVIPDSDKTLTDICYNKAHEMYGEELPTIVEERLKKELNSIITNGFAVMYIIAQKLVWKLSLIHISHLTIEKNISYVADLYGKRDKKAVRERVSQLLALVELPEEVRRRYPDELSGGQKQRVGIARALMNSPEIMLMDEPFGAVDEITRRRLQEEIGRIHRQQKETIVFVTHDIDEALRLGTRIVVMDEGKIIQDGTPQEIRANPATDFVKKLISDR